MTTNIKNAMAGQKRIASERPREIGPSNYPKPSRRSSGAKQGAIGVLAFFGPALGLSASCDYLFFKELLLACAIVGMTILLSSANHPSILIIKKGAVGRI